LTTSAIFHNEYKLIFKCETIDIAYNVVMTQFAQNLELI